MISQMVKIQIISLKEDKENLISILHNLGVLHIETPKIAEILKKHSIEQVTLEEKDEKEICQELIQKVDKILSGIKENFQIDIEKFKQETGKFSCQDVLTKINEITKELEEIQSEKEKLAQELLILSHYKTIIESFLKTDYDLSGYEDVECLALIFPRKFAGQIKNFQKIIEEKIKHKLDIYLSEFNKKKVVALVFYNKRFSRDIDEEIFKKGVEKIIFPQQIFGNSFADSFSSIKKTEEVMRKRIENLEARRLVLLNGNFNLFYSAKLTCKDKLDEIIIQTNLIKSNYTIILTGWIPKEKFKSTKEILEKEFKNKIIIEDITKTVKNKAEFPVLLKNPESTKPFELLLSLLQPPKYKTIDPTIAMSLFFPIFFGLIVGDIGYGFILFLIGIFLKKFKKDIFHSISKIIIYVSLTTIFFGILFAEFFGNILPYHPVLFHRQKEIVPFLILSVSIGGFHILLGLVLGMVNALRNRHKKEIWEKVSLLFFLCSLFLLVGIFSKFLHRGFLVPSTAFLIVSLSILIVAKGFIGPLETLSFIANILSYARIMALGLAGFMMAHIANTFAGLIENVILGVIVASLIHILNLVLSVFSPTIQSLRLHYVEFFSKFYEPGGKKYIPFRKQGGAVWKF